MTTETHDPSGDQDEEIPYEEYSLQVSPATKDFTAIVKGESRAYVISGELICGNIPFTFTPMPSGDYAFRVDAGSENFLKKVINHAVHS